MSLLEAGLITAETLRAARRSARALQGAFGEAINHHPDSDMKSQPRESG